MAAVIKFTSKARSSKTKQATKAAPSLEQAVAGDALRAELKELQRQNRGLSARLRNEIEHEQALYDIAFDVVIAVRKARAEFYPRIALENDMSYRPADELTAALDRLCEFVAPPEVTS